MNNTAYNFTISDIAKLTKADIDRVKKSGRSVNIHLTEAQTIRIQELQSWLVLANGLKNAGGTVNLVMSDEDKVLLELVEQFGNRYTSVALEDYPNRLTEFRVTN